eukprot:CAMPEP_0172690700 /NCGR_PEP_ID=MMETSP1074-20121228/24043_1 /TAXON_ID=2916 /ORGANISM="Ceratium fusus, Strain PA161109" /LENGTH=408 /DNA_ID=CAMNT_0013510681 /DNA_START=59 /DNA_END=1282 /DNA_ORIENTATION=-
MLRRERGQQTGPSSRSMQTDPSEAEAWQQDDRMMTPQMQKLVLPELQPSLSGTSTADPVTHVLDWLGHYDFRADAHSSSGALTSLDNAEDDTCDDVPVFDAQRFDAVPSDHREVAGPQVVRPSSHIKHDSRHDTKYVHFAGSGMAQISTTPGKVDCALASSKCFNGDGHPEQPVGANSRDYFLDEETERWDQRQQHSGAVGRLVIYHAGQSPKEDIFLRGGGRHHIILAGLHDGGTAARAGVKVGDRLVSVDGKKDLLGLHAEAVQDELEAPVVLVFLGFVGKLEAEVRLRFREQAFGMSSRREAVWGTHGAPLQVCEERVFNVGEAPLLLAVMPSWQSMQHMQESDEEDSNVEHEDKESRKNSRQTKVIWRRTPGHSTSWTKHVSEVAPCFELQRSEANSLVKRVLW